MQTMHKCLVVLVLCLLSVCQATIEKTFLHADTRRLIHFSEAFGFGRGGILEMELKDIKVYKVPTKSKKPVEVKYNLLGFFLAPAIADIKLEQDDTPQNCALDHPQGGRVLFRFNESDVQRAIAGGGKGGAVVRRSYELKDGGSMKLHFSNCESDAPVSFKARIVMYNKDAKGRKYYLSVGETELATMYTVMFFLFTAAAGGWIYLLISCKDQSHKIHYLMLALVVFKALTLLCEAAKFHYVGATGRPEGWNIAYYIFTSLRGLMFFMVVVLIGTGWSYMKPFLGDRERRILMIVLPLQVFANIAIIISGEETPAVQDWAAWQDIFHLVDIICCCAVLFPIVWSIKHLREAAQTDGKAARNMEKLTLFRQFYVMVVVYIYFTRIVVYLLESTMEYQYIWLSAAAAELATLAFYTWTAVKFRPHKDNPYLKLHQEEIEL